VFFDELGPHRGSIDLWQYVARNSCQFVKGWGANLDKEKRVFKENLLARIAASAEANGLDEEG
jgi:hypothetical protein